MCFYLMAMNMLVNPTDICRKLDEGITLISQVDQTHYSPTDPPHESILPHKRHACTNDPHCVYVMFQ